jgi:hypothetical protein
MLLLRVGSQISLFQYACKLETLSEERGFFTNKQQKLVPEKIWQENDQE